MASPKKLSHLVLQTNRREEMVDVSESGVMIGALEDR